MLARRPLSYGSRTTSRRDFDTLSGLAHPHDHDLATLDRQNDRVVVDQIVVVELEDGAEYRLILGGSQGIAYGRRIGAAGASDGVDQYLYRFVRLEADQHRRDVILLRKCLDERLVGGRIDRRILRLDRRGAVQKPALHDFLWHLVHQHAAGQRNAAAEAVPLA